MKKYVGNALKGNWDDNYNVFITVKQLEIALNLPENSLTNLIAKHNYNAVTNTFATPALHLNEYNGDKQLQLKLQLAATRSGSISVSLNEWQPQPQPQPLQKEEQKVVITNETSPEDDLPF